MKFGWLGCLLLASACSMSRPEGAYEPELTLEDDDSDEPPKLVRDAGARDARVIPRRDSGGSSPTKDAAVGTSPDDDDASEEQPASTHPLAALTGVYLMRMDIYSDVVTNTSLVKLNLHNRLSNVYFVEFSLDGDQLVSDETLCDQIYEHQCVDGCSTWQTLVSQGAVDKFFDMPPTTRRYTFDEASGKLTSDKTTIALGYTQNMTKSVPTDKSDSRLWKVDNGWGVYTEFSAAIKAIGNPKVNCQVSSVQLFATSIAGTLPKERSIEGVEFELDTAGTEGAVVNVTGTPTSQCTKEQFDGQQPLNEVSKVHFKRYSGEGCPADFDKEFPPKVRFIE